MNSFHIRAHAKINLTLDILHRAPNGYHYIQSVMHEVPHLYDELTLTALPSQSPAITGVETTNTVFRALELLKSHFPQMGNVHVELIKNIPIGSGLGGGSSDAVAALKAVVELFNLPCCVHKKTHSSSCILRTIAAEIGSDCAFFFDGGTAYATGFGEHVQQLPEPPELEITIVPTNITILTKDAYGLIDTKKTGQLSALTQDMIDALMVGDPEGIIKNLHNDFEELIFDQYPTLQNIKSNLIQGGKGRVLLCGSGGALVQIALREM
ncbi:4-(cytidine 5'-diphospho)-2-C-methyl-D-erythritol kinase [Candidatus Gracilibacteria bacterium]|nr:4-(cytidine 5'-diphospho)-2-C-methyl-D-erythritol kinase [Candidatus Gracilibacteria bacterium]